MFFFTARIISILLLLIAIPWHVFGNQVIHNSAVKAVKWLG
jgi:hypothetical protein